MKLEKREVTLNEKDTLKDALAYERMLLSEYALAATEIAGTERRAIYGEIISQSLRDVFYLADLLKDAATEKEE